jgi:putative peptide zinc metalloprotease protein
MNAAAQEKQVIPLPALREELTLIRGKTNSSGEQAWRIYDPVQHRFMEVDNVTVEMLSVWQIVKNADELRRELQHSRGISVSLESIEGLIKFAHANFLTKDSARGDWKSLAEIARRSKKSWGSWLLHNYLFFRIPLVKPQGFLVESLPLVQPLFNRRLISAIAVLGVVGIYLVSRQWDQFANTFQHFFTPEGAVEFASALFLVKALHELGHAYTAVRFGCQVPAMGVAFMMMTPMLYTDVTDAWRLPMRRQRMKIDFAGVAVELMIACVATFLWSFLPEGKAKSIAFLLATSSLLMSLAINLSPFMRFDGYFILADLVGVPNLQPRAFAVARWKLREILFGLDAPCPEDMSKPKLLGLTVYAWATWIYRFGLYLGIAAVVYFYFFKVLGIILFAVEVAVFLVGPFVSEFREWYKMRGQITNSKRWLLPAGLALSIAVAAIVPWSTRVDIPVIIESAMLAHIYPPRPALITSVHVVQGQTVEAGAELLTLSSDQLKHDIDVATNGVARVKAQLARLTADDTDRENNAVLTRELSALQAKLHGLRAEEDELKIRSPLAGRVLELNPELHEGRTIGQKEMIALIGSDDALSGRGYVSESELSRVSVGQTGKFVPENVMRKSYEVTILDISLRGAQAIDIVDLASVNGGRIAVQADQQRRLVPVSAVYAVKLAVGGSDQGPGQRIRGVAQVDAEAVSFAGRVWRQIAKVLIRESGA